MVDLACFYCPIDVKTLMIEGWINKQRTLEAAKVHTLNVNICYFYFTDVRFSMQTSASGMSMIENPLELSD